MSSTEVALSPTKKKTKQLKMEQQQIVSNDVTNESDSNESVNQPELINNNNETNKDCREVDACMEPLLIQECAIDDNDNDNNEFVTTNPINENNCVFSDDNSVDSPNEVISVCDIISKNIISSCDVNNANVNGMESPSNDNDSGGGGGFMKSNLSLNLNNESIFMSSCDGSEDEKAKSLPKNKKFLDSTDDQIMNQIFFQTITITPTTDDDIGKFLISDNTPLTPSELDTDLNVGPVDFFNRKIDEDEAFDSTYTDTADNYQECDNDANLCSLNDNFNDNYCSFSSIDYNTTNIQHAQASENEKITNSDNDGEKTLENDQLLLQPKNFLGGYAEKMRQQRPSIVIDCYDSDSKTDDEEGANEQETKKSLATAEQETSENDVVIGEEKINDYCFYFDQTIEEDDDDACYINDINENLDGIHLKQEHGSNEHVVDDDDDDDAEQRADINDVEASNDNNGKTLEASMMLVEQGEDEPNDIDECVETEDELFNEEDDDVDGDECEDVDVKSDEGGVINESCLSVNVSGCCFNTCFFFLSLIHILTH